LEQDETLVISAGKTSTLVNKKSSAILDSLFESDGLKEFGQYAQLAVEDAFLVDIGGYNLADFKVRAWLVEVETEAEVGVLEEKTLTDTFKTMVVDGKTLKGYTTTIDFTFNSINLVGKDVVVYAELWRKNKQGVYELVHEHKDKNNQRETIRIVKNELPGTGGRGIYWLLLVSVCGILSLLIILNKDSLLSLFRRKKGRHKI
jgi:hypothetical protein